MDCRYRDSAQDALEDGRWNKMMGDALYLRGKALLSTWRPKLAKLDAGMLAEFDEGKAGSLARESDAFKAHREKSNKKLSRDIAKWVDTAMTISENIRTGKESADLSLDDVDDDDADDEYYDAKEEL